MGAPLSTLLAGRSAGAGAVEVARLVKVAGVQATLAGLLPLLEERKRRMVSLVKFRFNLLVVRKVTLMM